MITDHAYNINYNRFLTIFKLLIAGSAVSVSFATPPPLPPCPGQPLSCPITADPVPAPILLTPPIPLRHREWERCGQYEDGVF